MKKLLLLVGSFRFAKSPKGSPTRVRPLAGSLRTRCLILGALLVCGCGSKNGFAAFVVNQDAQSAGSKPGKSYNAEPCFLMVEKSSFFSVASGLVAQPSHLHLKVMFPKDKPVLEKLIGQTVEGSSGEVQLDAKEYELEKITVTVQTLQDGIARGNFNARIKGQTPPWEVVGSFDAKVKF